jgi:phosphoenolpyruvate---glycerone phosphotransferase subunit DhaL
MAVGAGEVRAWMEALRQVYGADRAYLTELDSAIGDADHGTNMDRGFTAAQAAVAGSTATDIGVMLESVAMVLIRTVGGASGPLYGTFFLRAGGVCKGKVELDAADVVALFEAGIEGIRQRGKAAAGDKTMLDALLPALEAMREGLREGAGLTGVLEAGAAAAQDGMRATIPMQARKGRASYLGPRSVGHQDPGATSAWLLVKAAAETWEE